MALNAENQLGRMENQQMDLGEDWYTRRKIKHRKLSKYCHWKKLSDSMVLATTKGEIKGKCFPGRRRTAWIDDVRQRTGDEGRKEGRFLAKLHCNSCRM